MKLFKRIDTYLLHHYPSIWITRVHYFLPLGLAIFALLFFGNHLIGWNPKNDLPESEIAIVLMIIPVLIYLVYWFVFQSRYNVAKSGGKMTIGFEYLNFFIYLLVFFVAFLIICAIPLSNQHKVKTRINVEEFKADVEKLNLGNTLVNGSNRVVFLPNGTIEFTPTEFIYDFYYDYSYDFESTQYETSSVKVVSRKEALQIINDFKTAYNKYTFNPIMQSDQEILKSREIPDNPDLYYDSFYNDWDVQYKIGSINGRVEEGFWYEPFNQPWFWKIAVGLLAFLALLVWIFKQMKLRHFVFGFITICITPLLIAIVGVILFELVQIRGNEEKTISSIILITYGILTFFVLRAYAAQTLNNTGYVMTMYLQFFLPGLPLFLWMFFSYRDYYYSFNSEYTFNLLYWISWIVGMTSILAFKPLYSKFRSLPSKN